jgi:hypothetical protein
MIRTVQGAAWSGEISLRRDLGSGAKQSEDLEVRMPASTPLYTQRIGIGSKRRTFQREAEDI